MCENMAISNGHYTESGNCSVFYEEKGSHALSTHVSYLGKGRHALDTCISHLPNFTKKTVNRSFSTPCFMCQHTACPLAHIHACMCTNGHTAYKIMERDVEHKLLEIFEAL
jgi:hypothetical protein